MLAPAAAAASDTLAGRYAFNWRSDPAKAKCAKIDDKRLAEFASPSYRCDLTPASNTASGAPAVKCGRRDEKVEYLIFQTRAACETERQAQAANGD